MTRVSASAFTLEDDAIVAGSPFLEEIETAGLPIERWPAPPAGRRFHSRARRSRRCAGRRGGRGRMAGAATRSRPPADARFKGATGPARAAHLRHQLSRALPRLPVQVLGEPGAEAAGGARRRVGTDADRARALHPRRVRTFFSEWQVAGGGHDHHRRTWPTRWSCSKRSPSAKLDDAARGGSRARTDAPARLGGRFRPGRARVRLRDRAGGRGRRAAARARARRGVHVRRRGRARAGCGSGPRPTGSTCMADGTLRIIDYKLGQGAQSWRARCSCRSTA